MTEKLQVMDLFAGAGGLSDGFEQTDQFQVKIAVEINENARKTYLENHPHVKQENFHKDITALRYKNENGTLIEEYKNIDVIIGGIKRLGESDVDIIDAEPVWLAVHSVYFHPDFQCAVSRYVCPFNLL